MTIGARPSEPPEHSSRELRALVQQTRKETHVIRARARHAWQGSMVLRDRVARNVLWVRVMAAERNGTSTIAGGADEDGARSKDGRVVLIVDDHADTREMYAQFLQAMGFATREATTCAEALAASRRGGIDAIVLDRRLPDGDGIEVCRTLRADARTRDLPIVVLSGRHADGATGADVYLVKPVVPDDLCRELERLVTSRGTPP